MIFPLNRKFVLATIILACIWAACGNGKASPEFFQISQLSQQADLYWKESYTNERGETIGIDVTIMVPQVKSAPVLYVSRYPDLSEGFFNNFQVPSKEESYKWAAYSDQDITIGARYNWELAINPAKENPGRVVFKENYFTPSEIDWDREYAMNNPMTIKEAYETITEKLEELYLQYGSNGYYPMTLSYAYTSGLYDEKGKDLREQEGYAFVGTQVIRGIPIMGNVMPAYFNMGNRTYYPFEAMYESKIELGITSKDSYEISTRIFSEKSLIESDMPLIKFAAVKPEVEKLIAEGRVRRIYSIQLAYIAYMEPDHNNEQLVLVPSWVIECDYFNSAKDNAPDMDENEGIYFKKSPFYRLIFNAQTGKMIDPRDAGSKRSDCPQIITWDQVKK